MSDELEKYEAPLPGDYAILDRETLEERLTGFILELLQYDFARLTNLIYRHDVNEHLFNKALEAPGLIEQAKAIARLVVDRELQKVETRKKYGKQNKTNLNQFNEEP